MWIPDDPTKFNKLKNTVNPIYICKACSNNLNVQDHPEQNQNPLDSLPFADENILDDIFGSSDDIQNPPEEPEDIEEHLGYKIFQKRGLHFIHINANSILSKLEEVKIIAFETKAAVIGISESKLDETVLNGEIQIPGYNILRSDRNRHGGGVLCYIKDTICYKQRENFSD